MTVKNRAEVVKIARQWVAGAEPTQEGRWIAQALIDADADRLYHSDQITRLACAIGAAGETSVDVVTKAIKMATQTEAHAPAGDLISIAAIQEEIVHITQNGIDLAKFCGQDADEGRCRELCAMYLSEFILSHRLAQQLDALEAQRNELAVAAANRRLDAASSPQQEKP